MTADEIAEQQADVTRLLLHHVQAPLTGTAHVRGVLPVPPPGEAVRVVTGAADACTPYELTAYEMPLRTGSGYLTGYDAVAVLRTLHTGTRIHPGARADRVMGIPLVRVDPAAVAPTAQSTRDRALTILRTLVHPFTEDRAEPLLLGFLFLAPDRLRLYLASERAPGVVAADVRPSGAVTALLAALPSLIEDDGRAEGPEGDPHCSTAVDLTHW